MLISARTSWTPAVAVRNKLKPVSERAYHGLGAGGVTYDILEYVNTDRFETAIIEELLPEGSLLALSQRLLAV